MSNKPSQREIHVFCDFETNKALVRIFKYRNFSWSGGKVMEFDRESNTLKRIDFLIKKYGVENKSLLIQTNIFWNNKTEKAVKFCLDMNVSNPEKEETENVIAS